MPNPFDRRAGVSTPGATSSSDASEVSVADAAAIVGSRMIAAVLRERPAASQHSTSASHSRRPPERVGSGDSGGGSGLRTGLRSRGGGGASGNQNIATGAAGTAGNTSDGSAGSGGRRGRRKSMVPQAVMEFSLFRRRTDKPSVKDSLAVVGLKKALLVGKPFIRNNRVVVHGPL